MFGAGHKQGMAGHELHGAKLSPALKFSRRIFRRNCVLWDLGQN